MDNTLYYGDNLVILRDFIKDDSVDLIYLDPPFNSKADYNILYKEPTGERSQAQITAFEDTWHWGGAVDTFNEIMDTAPTDVAQMMKSFKDFLGPNDMMAYLSMMCIRLTELRRVLKDTGSIYLHCDPTASHYLKILMDTIFGKMTFRNEVIWHYRRWSASANRYQGLHDVILFYTKSAKNIHTFNLQLMPYTEKTNKRWKGQRMHNIVTEEGKLLKTPAPEEEEKGANLGDVWQISIINSQARERLGYPTQKPESLLERIINVSSNEGDVVLDPFCGCGTSISVSEKLKRKWIGIDITYLAMKLIKDRLRDTYKLEAKKDYQVFGEPEDIASAIQLANEDKWKFQSWAVSLVDKVRNYVDAKKGSDRGIDGIMYFADSNDHKKVIIQVKGGHVSVKDINELCHVIDREKAEIGIFITLHKPTSHMTREAIEKGDYKAISGKRYPKIQILTIEQLLDGTQPKIPQTISVDKKAPKNNQQPDKLF
jgi:site-specific DNA-methyltransferase (adenine-specific)